jgi:hypothetical protein
LEEEIMATTNTRSSKKNEEVIQAAASTIPKNVANEKDVDVLKKTVKYLDKKIKEKMENLEALKAGKQPNQDKPTAPGMRHR